MSRTRHPLNREFFMAPLILALCAFFLGAAPVLSDQKREKAYEALFYDANSSYEKGEYQKAIDGYNEIAGRGLESGNLYYNVGNAYFKLGELGQAVLYYERAKALIPRDADLKSNLAYAQSLIEESPAVEGKAWWMAFLEGLTSFFDMRALTVLLSAAWSLLMLLLALYVVRRDRFRKGLAAALAVTGLVLTAGMASFGVRAYEREFLKPAIVLAKEAECRFEPFDTSTVYFKVYAGTKVFVLASKGEWAKVRRSDGKMAWMKSDTVSLI